eukprot:CAMPEP_0172510916 /NCGR_PEP_ID=MMETSP1066-20121228/232361_1 /TAXON_ID=671091 /ORGANISM="Coscinodiscus wailesii, Strain CCMP2513" /LENGTH=808 /DNA_ID=CAMNT_0013290085 /DNA_START=379 /DNA_END=2805 /DNA_ORIENTATION=-
MTKNTNNLPAVANPVPSTDKQIIDAKMADIDTKLPPQPTPTTSFSTAPKPTTSNSKSLPAALGSTTDPHENDVLCGRGGSINNHIGNEKYRTLVTQKKRVYLTARFKREKRLIAASIVQAIRNMDPPGRFLARDSRTQVWYDIGDVKARDKTSQALREGAPEIRKEMENDRQRQIMSQGAGGSGAMGSGGSGQVVQNGGRTVRGASFDVAEEDEFEEYAEMGSPGGALNGYAREDMIPRSHSMNDVEMSFQHKGQQQQQLGFQPLRSSLKLKKVFGGGQSSGAGGVIPSPASAWSRTSPSIDAMKRPPSNGYRDQLRNGRSVHFDEEDLSSPMQPASGFLQYRKSNGAGPGGPGDSDGGMLHYAKSWDNNGASVQSSVKPPYPQMDRINQRFSPDAMIPSLATGYDSDTTAPQSSHTRARSFDERSASRRFYYDDSAVPGTHQPRISPHQMQRAKFHHRYQQQANAPSNLRVIPPPSNNAMSYKYPNNSAFDQRFASTPPPTDKHHMSPHPSPLSYRQRHHDMPPPAQRLRPVPSIPKRRMEDMPAPAPGAPTPSWEAEMLRLAQGDAVPAENSSMEGIMKSPSGGQGAVVMHGSGMKRESKDMAMVPVMNAGDQMMQDQLEIQLRKNDDPSNKQLVESRIENDDWSARLSCSALLHIPQDWAPSFFNRTNSFEHAEASLCGMELCSVGSLGGGSLCNVFIEDDPNKKQSTGGSGSVAKSDSKTDRVRQTSSWGSGRNSLASGRSLMSPFGSDIGSDTSLMSKSSDRLEPIPIGDSNNPAPIFSTAGFANDAPVDHDFVWSWDGKGTE